MKTFLEFADDGLIIITHTIDKGIKKGTLGGRSQTMSFGQSNGKGKTMYGIYNITFHRDPRS